MWYKNSDKQIQFTLFPVVARYQTESFMENTVSLFSSLAKLPCPGSLFLSSNSLLYSVQNKQ